MLKFILVCIALFVGCSFVGCSQKPETPKSKVKVALDRAVLATLNGGVVIGARAPGLNTRLIRVITSEDGQVELTLPHGVWDFFAIGWPDSGAGNFSGVPKCGAVAPQELNQDGAAVNITLTAAGCDDDSFAGPNFRTGGTFKLLEMYTCAFFDSITDTNTDTCPNNQVGLAQSFKVIVPEGQLISGLEFGLAGSQLESDCQTLLSYPGNGLVSPTLRIPVGTFNGAGYQFPLIIRAYGSATCDETASFTQDLTFPIGMILGQDILGSNFRKLGFDAANTRLFIRTSAFAPLFDGTRGHFLFDTDGDDLEAEIIFEMALQSDGRIVAVGKSDVLANGGTQSTIWILEPDGTLAAVTGANPKVFDIGGNNDNFFRTVAIDSSDRIIACGRTGGAPPKAFCQRYDSDGNIDATFNAGVIQFINPRATNNTIEDVVVVEATGFYQIYGAGSGEEAGTDSILYLVIDQNGAIVNTTAADQEIFPAEVLHADNGVATGSAGTFTKSSSIIFHDNHAFINGQMTTAHDNTPDMVIIKIDSSHDIVAGFRTVYPDLGDPNEKANASQEGFRLKVLSNNDIMVAGTTQELGGGEHKRPFLMRIDKDTGDLVTSFNSSGNVPGVTDLQDPACVIGIDDEEFIDFLVDEVGGYIYTVGGCGDIGTPDYRASIRRFYIDGTLDDTFFTLGVLAFENSFFNTGNSLVGDNIFTNILQGPTALPFPIIGGFVNNPTSAGNFNSDAVVFPLLPSDAF